MLGIDLYVVNQVVLTLLPDYRRNRADKVVLHHNKFRNTFVEHDGFLQPAPSPRFSRTTAKLEQGAAIPGTHSRLILQQLGYSAAEIDSIIEAAVIETEAQADSQTNDLLQ